MFFKAGAAAEAEAVAGVAARRLVDLLGDADAAGLGLGFDAGGEIDGVAEDVAAAQPHLAHVQADAEAAGDGAGARLAHALLDGHGVVDRRQRAVEQDQHAVAGVLDEDAAVVGAKVLKEGEAAGDEVDRRQLVGRGQAAELLQIGKEDRPELGTFHGPLVGWARLSTAFAKCLRFRRNCKQRGRDRWRVVRQLRRE
jgi:hypothetical protein